jgi:hypothetical protein
MFLGFVFRMLIAGIIAIAIYAYFLLVLSPADAMAVAIAVACVDLAAPMFLPGTSNAGGAIRVLGLVARVCAPVLAWPGLTWLISHGIGYIGYSPCREFVSPVAAGLSSFLILLGGRGSGQDHARNWAIILTLAFLLAVMIFSFGNGRLSDAASATAGALGIAATRLGIVWTDTPKVAVEWTIILLVFSASAPLIFYLVEVLL